MHVLDTKMKVSYVLKLLLPVIVVVLIINILLISGIRKGNTTLIVQEIHNKHGSDGLSSSDTVKERNEVGKDKNRNLRDKAEGEVIKSRDDTELHDTEKNRKQSENGKSAKDREIEIKTFYIETMQDDKIDAMVSKLRTGKDPMFPSYFWNSSLADLAKRLGALARRTGKTLEGYKKLQNKANMSNWRLVHRDIRQYALYNPDNPAVDGLLHDMATQKISEIDENEGGTQLKLTLNFDDGGRAVFKPMRYAREIGANPNHYIFDDLERHIAEIAAFHLDRILGFYRVPPTIGRKVNLTTEIKPLVPRDIAKTFHLSPAGNVCFYGVCDYYCDSAHAFCGNPHMIEGSVQSYLPSRNIASRTSWYQPWQRSYSKFRKAVWEKDDTYCKREKYKSPLNNGKMLLDLIDAHTFDFLTGNKDRHSFSLFKEWGNYSFPIMYDNGRGFGRQDYDAMSILAPLRQCCMIRKSTFLKYTKLYTGPDRLSALMEKSLASDPVAPVLLPGHLNALDRRLKKILLTVAKCLESGASPTRVIISDKF